MSKEKKIFQLEKKEICITSSQIKQAIDLLVNENEILREEIERLKEEYIMLQNASDEVEEEKDKEIERQKEIIRQLDINNLELTTIIKEVREYIKTCNPDVDLYSMFLSENYISNYGARDILEILDKENNNENN